LRSKWKELAKMKKYLVPLITAIGIAIEEAIRLKAVDFALDILEY
jgi:hypothetical protein